MKNGRIAPWVGLGTALVLVTLAVLLPRLLDWQVYSNAHPSPDDVAPLHALWDPGVGVGTVPALLIAGLGWRYAIPWAERLRWGQLLAASYAVGLGWFLALAYVDGSSGISRVLGNPYEYLPTARNVHDIPAMLSTYISRIPYASPDNWVTHVAGHPPGTLLFFVILDRGGLGSDWAAGMVVTLIAATTSIAVLVALRALGAEGVARRAAPFLVLGPAAVWTAVSTDALFAAVAAWGLAALAVGATRGSRRAKVAWSVLAGLLLGYCMMMSYGLPLLGLLAVAVLWAARSLLPLLAAAVAAAAVVLAFAAGGFALWEALPVLQQRYWDGIAADRPASYWMWANLAVLCISAGPVLGAGLGRMVALGRRVERPVPLLVGAAAAAVLLADASRMSKGETERIWLPFVPWLLLSAAVLPPKWRKAGLGLQVAVALVVQHLLYTTW